MHCTHIYYNYLLITDRIVKILALSIVSLQWPFSRTASVTAELQSQVPVT
jgi:hypothetical protein